MNNPNHPLYSALGGGSNIHLLDNMLFTAEQHKPILNSQYVYSNMEQLAAHQHAMNLAVSEQSHHVAAAVAATTIDSSALLYHHPSEHHQQQPISYKIPQVSTVLLGQHQHHQQHQPQAQHQHPLASAMASVSSLQDRKKDIIAEAMREEKIFDEMNASAKKSIPSTIINTPTIPTTSSSAPEPTASTPVAIKSEPPVSTSTANSTSPKPGPSTTPSSSRGRGAGRPPMRQQQQQIIPRLQLLDDEDDGLTCRMCLQQFWYKSELLDHLKGTHSIADPDRYERDEKDKRTRKMRDDQQRFLQLSRGTRGGRNRGVTIMSRGVGTIRGRNIIQTRPPPLAGPRPSFQYRDGSFICDLCKKSFSDGNDMVSHWKSHVKNQQPQKVPTTGPGRTTKTHVTSRGRPITKKQAGRQRRTSRKDKGKPRWTAYLLWSTRRRKEIALEHEGWTFAMVGKQISEEWKLIGPEEIEKLKEEADQLNLKKTKKLPKVSDSGSELTSEEEDPTFDETNLKKPIMMKIEREEVQRSGRQRKRPSFFQDFENEEQNLDKILDEFEQQQMEEAKNPKPKLERKTPGSSRPRRKREFIPEEEEEEESIELETTRSGRVRKKTKFFHFDDEEGDDDEDEEDRDEYQPDSEPEEPDEEFLESEEEQQEEENKEGEGEGEGGTDVKPVIIGLMKKKRRQREKKDDDDESKESWEDSDEEESETPGSGDENEEEGAAEDDSGNRKHKKIKVEKEDVEVEAENEQEAAEDGTEPTPDKVSKTADEGFTEENRTAKEEPMEDEDNEAENDLEGSVTEEDPPENLFGDENADDTDNVGVNVDDNVVVVSKDGPDLEEDDVEKTDESEFVEESSNQQQDPFELEGSDDPVTDPVAVVEQESANEDILNDGDIPAEAEQGVSGETPSVEDLLSEPEPAMESGDKEYKDMIAETQLENIFN